MPRIILKTNYLKAQSKNVSGFLKYIATRDGVVKYTSDSGLLSATKKQKDFIAEFLKLYPDSNTLFEYEDYQKNPSRENASALISSVADYYLLDEKHSNPELYAKYVATRPNSQKLNTHGLFGMTENISLAKSMEELVQHKGNVWTHIVSIRREDAQRLGYDNVDSWVNLVRSQSAELAKQMKIKPHNLVWYGAFHDESYHPHIHLMVYSKDESEGYLTKTGIGKLRGAFAQNIFKQDLISIYDRQTTARDDLKQELLDALHELEEIIATGDFNNEPLRAKFIKLAEDLSQRKKGKNTYGYLPKVLKKQVDELLDLFAEEKSVAACYTEWNTLRHEVLSTYQDTEAEILPLSGQKEFQHLKNIIIKNAVEYIHPVLPSMVAEPVDSSPRVLVEDIQFHFTEEDSHPTIQNTQDFQKRVELLRRSADQQNPYAQYQLATLLLSGEQVEQDIPKAIEYLHKASQQNHESACYLLGRLYEQGELVEKDESEAFRQYHKIAETNKHASYRLGKLILNSNELNINRGVCIYWLEKSAEQGNPLAWFKLGQQYIRGELVGKNIPRALFYLEKAAEENNSFAHLELAKLYLYDIGVNKDESLGMEYLLHSIRLGNEYAQQLLEHYQRPKLETAFGNILHCFHSLFSSPPEIVGGYKQPVIDRKRLSKLKRKKIALGHAEDDEVTMKS